MTSSRKIEANRANARRSTGPKTARGRERSAKNALRHGLSLSISLDAALSQQAEDLARQIAGPGARQQMFEFAQKIAEAQVDLRRIRDARYKLLSAALDQPYYDTRASRRKYLAFLSRLLSGNDPDISVEALAQHLTSPLEGADKLAAIFSNYGSQLVALDRYERRAISRRKVAMRNFDNVRYLT